VIYGGLTVTDLMEIDFYQFVLMNRKLTDPSCVGKTVSSTNRTKI